MTNERRINAQILESPEGPTIDAQEVSKVHTTTSVTVINNLPSLSFFEVGHIFSFPSSPPFFVFICAREACHSPALMENPSSQLTFENHPFFQDLLPLSLGLKLFYQVLATEGDIFEKFSGLSIDCSF